MVRPRIFSLIALSLCCSLLVNGCHFHTRLPSETDHASVEQHTIVMVLLRLKTILDGRPLEEIELENGGYGFGLRLGRIESDEAPKFTFWTSPTSETRRLGWIYLVLAPGDYNLLAARNGRPLSPGFLLQVPQEKKLVYAETLTISCKGRTSVWQAPVGECSGVIVTDEGEAARAIAQSYFGKFGPMSAALQEKRQASIAPQVLGELFPMGYVSAAASKDLASPDWVKRGLKRGAALEVGAAAAGLTVLTGVPGAFLATAYVLYLPVGLTAGAIAGKSAEKKWQPCLQELAREIKESDPAAALQKKLDEEVKKFYGQKAVPLSPEGDPYESAARRGLKSLLQTEVQRIQIRECRERGSFCLEVAVRARLWQVPGKRLCLDKTLVYTSLHPLERSPSEMQVPGAYLCRKMELYCGPEGQKIFREEMAAAISKLVDRLLTEVGL